MSERKYYDQEYNFLHDAGRDFAERHGSVAGKLRMDGDYAGKDPFVERMLEAFAFLSGRIHQRLDDDIPEFAGGLLEQLFPHMLRPFPSCTILQATPSLGSVTEAVPIKRGSEIQGRGKIEYKVPITYVGQDRTEVKKEDAEFVFRTTRDFHALPIRLDKVDTYSTEDRRSILSLEFRLNRNVTYEALALDRLTFYLNGPPRQKYTLLHYLSAHSVSLSVREKSKDESLREKGQEKNKFEKVPNFKIGIPELHEEMSDENEYAILPNARQTFTGYRLLQEYFAFPEKFFFIDILGLDQILKFNQFKTAGKNKSFEIRIEFNRPLAQEFQPTEKDILINCVPAVNLFDRSSDPVVVDRRKPEYYIVPRGDRKQSREIYSVNEVSGFDDNKQVNYHYTPVTSYKVWDANDPGYSYKRFYSVVLRPDDKGWMGRAYIRLFGPSLEQDQFPRETLSLETTMSNGYLASSEVTVGKLRNASFAQGVSATNIIAATDVLACPREENFLWLLISHLTVSYSTLAESEKGGNNLKTLLNLYNWARKAGDANRKRIEQGIINVEKPKEIAEYRNRIIVRGVEFKIMIDQQQFEQGEGDIYLFYLVLSRFLAEYLTINSFITLKFEDKDGKEYQWHQRQGEISLI